MALKKKKVVLITNGTRFSEVTEKAWKKSAELYKADGYREATEAEVISYTGAEPEPIKVKKQEVKETAEGA